MGLDAASYQELWRITAETGVLPEHILPTLYFESGFDPSRPNAAGAPFYGLNQASEALINQYAQTDPQTYLTWPASAQIRTVVRGYVRALVNTYGKIKSATKFEQANFYPASLKTATDLNDVIVSAPSAAYEANRTLDKDKKGSITVADIAAVMMKAAESKAVQQAIANTYAAKGRYAPLDVGVTGVSEAMLLDDDGSIGLNFQRRPAIGLGSSPEDINHIVYGDDYSWWARTWAGHPVLERTTIAAGAVIGAYALARWYRWI